MTTILTDNIPISSGRVPGSTALRRTRTRDRLVISAVAPGSELVEDISGGL